MAYETPVAEVYDLFFPPDRSTEADLWSRLAGPAGAHLLEPMAGTCEVATLLARRGYWVTGVELSPAMAEYGRARIAGAEQAVAQRLSLVEGDICTVPLPKRHFDLAYVGNGSWHLLNTPERRAAALRSIRRSLKPGAHLALELFPPIVADSRTEPKTFQPLRSAPEGVSVWKTSVVDRNALCQLMRIEEEIRVNEMVTRHHLVLQLLMPDEITAELLAAGFRGIALFGDHALTPYRPESSSRLLVVASQ